MKCGPFLEPTECLWASAVPALAPVREAGPSHVGCRELPPHLLEPCSVRAGGRQEIKGWITAAQRDTASTEYDEREAAGVRERAKRACERLEVLKEVGASREGGGIFVKDESGVCVCIRLQPGERLGVAHLTRMQEHETLRIWMHSIAQTHNKKDNEHFWTLDAVKDSVLLINTESRSGAFTRICERELKCAGGSSIISTSSDKLPRTFKSRAEGLEMLVKFVMLELKVNNTRGDEVEVDDETHDLHTLLFEKSANPFSSL